MARLSSREHASLLKRLDNLAAGVTLDEFLDNFPTVTPDQALAVLKFSNQTLKKLGQAR